jgi:WD40 repeat protein
VNSVALHPDGHRFVTGGVDFYVYSYDFESGQQLGMCGAPRSRHTVDNDR